MQRTSAPKRRLDVELLEGRALPSVSSLWFSGNMLVVKTDNAATSVQVNPSGSNIVVQEVGTAKTWTYSAASVGSVQFQGGAGNDRFVNNVYALPVSGYGFGGNDYL